MNKFRSNRPRWVFEIATTPSWLDTFVARDNATEIVVRTEYSDYEAPLHFWSSPHLDELQYGKGLFDRTAALKTVFDGIFRITMGHDYYPLEFGALLDARAKNLRQTGDTLSWEGGDPLAEPFSSTIMLPSLLPRTSSDYEDFLLLARHDELARDLLRFIGVNGISYVSLFGLLESLQQNGWSKKRISELGLASAEMLKDFERTANHPAAAGPFARHASSKFDPPKKVIPLQEASKVILKVARHFLHERLSLLRNHARGKA